MNNLGVLQGARGLLDFRSSGLLSHFFAAGRVLLSLLLSWMVYVGCHGSGDVLWKVVNVLFCLAADVEAGAGM